MVSNSLPYCFLYSNCSFRRGLPYSIFEIVFKYMTMEECQLIVASVCKNWKHFYFKMFCSYSSFNDILTNKFTANELKVIFDKGSTLVHIRTLKDIIRRDFRNQIKFFHSKIAVHSTVADNLFSLKRRRLNE